MKTPHSLAALALVAASIATASAQIANLSYRSYVGTGAAESTLSFSISGTGTEQVLIRAIGPSLTSQGLSSGAVLADPAIQLFSGSTLIAANDNWGDNANASQLTTAFSQVGAQPLANTDTASAALLLTLAPGTYRVRIFGVNATTGIALPELYLGPGGGSGFNFVSAESTIASGSQPLIAGTVVSGSSSSNLLVRALGPALGDSSATSDPSLTVYDSLHGNAVFGQNDNWSTNANAASIATATAALGLTSLAPGSTDSALLQTFSPGVYSYVVSHSVSANDGLVRLEIADATAVPEPAATAAVVALAALGLVTLARRRGRIV